MKQVIAWTSIFPASKFWRRSAARHIDDPERSRNNPEGGTALHWLADVIFIAATAAFSSLQTAITFPGNLLVYGHFIAESKDTPRPEMEAELSLTIITVAIGFAFAFGFRPGETGNTRSKDEFGAPNPPTWLRPKNVPWLGPILLGGIPAVFSGVVVVAVDIQPSERVYMWAMLVLLAVASLYWLGFTFNVLKCFGIDLEVRAHNASSGAERECRVCSGGPQNEQVDHRHDLDGYFYYLGRRKHDEAAKSDTGTELIDNNQRQQATPQAPGANSPRRRTTITQMEP